MPPALRLVASAAARGAPSPGSAAADAALANANNPLANMTAFNIQNYRMSSLYDTDATASTAWLRFAKPFGRVLVRASLPLSTISGPDAGLAVLQPFLFLQFGKVVKAGNTVFNLFIEPQSTMMHWGAGQPEFQVMATLNMQFLPK